MALIGPGVITALIVAGGAVVDQGGRAATLITIAIAAVPFAILAWSPLRTRGLVVALHAQGVVLWRRGSVSVVAFDDVDEVWFDVDPIHATDGAYLRSLYLVQHSGAKHRVPLGVENGATLANGVLRGCSGPLLIEARRALAAGETLSFGKTLLDPTGITIDGVSAPWPTIRLARLQPARVSLFRSLPLWPWRIVRLDRIPNPSVFAALVAQQVRLVKRDDRLLVPLESDPDRTGDATAASARGRSDSALRTMLVGGLVCVGGLAITWMTYSASNHYYVIALGPVIGGAIRFFQGFLALGSR
jgi:hypothetical protein